MGDRSNDKIKLPRGELVQLYHSMGLSFFPLKTGKKEPRLLWTEFQSRRPTSEEVSRWKQEDSNLALVCSRLSSDRYLVIQDFESLKDAKDYYSEGSVSLWNQLLETTLVVASPHGGAHVYYLSREACKREIRICKDHPIDILGEGGYAVAAPSSIDHNFCDRKKCQKTGNSSYSVISSTYLIQEVDNVRSIMEQRFRQLGWDLRKNIGLRDPATIASGVPDGLRALAAFDYSHHLFSALRGDEPTAWYELERWNKQNTPPLDIKELKRQFQSAWKFRLYHARGPPRRSLLREWRLNK